MKEPIVRFELDPSLDGIEVVIRAAEEDDSVSALIEKLTGHPPDTLLAFDGNGIMRTIAADDIISASVDGKLLSLVTGDGRWFTRQTLQSFEAAQHRRRFVRISRYELVNLDKVLRYDFTISGTLRIELVGGIETWASRRCIPLIRRKLAGKE